MGILIVHTSTLSHTLSHTRVQFVETELCGTPANSNEEREMVGACRGSEKSLKFHQSDTQITSAEFWFSWHQNEGEV